MPAKSSMVPGFWKKIGFGQKAQLEELSSLMLESGQTLVFFGFRVDFVEADGMSDVSCWQNATDEGCKLIVCNKMQVHYAYKCNRHLICNQCTVCHATVVQ